MNLKMIKDNPGLGPVFSSGMSLKTRIIVSFLIVIIFLGVFIALHRIYVIKRDIIDRAQNQVKNDLKIARFFYSGQIEIIKSTFDYLSPGDINLDQLKKGLDLDYLYLVKKDGLSGIKSEIVKKAFAGKKSVGGTRLIEADELEKMGPDIYLKAEIEIKDTPKARPRPEKILKKAMAIGYAKPIFDAAGNIQAVIYGGKILNRDFPLVDQIRNFVFENKNYGVKPVGTVTIFLDDIRIATNVLDKDGQRAIGTRVSASVYDKVVGQGKTWLDRAFVVTDWYLTAYEPIRDINGQVIGILYVGTLEKPFLDLQRYVLTVLILIVILAIILAIFLSVILAGTITRPVIQMLNATRHLSRGELQYRVQPATRIRELDELALAFNDMAGKLHEREVSLQQINEKLAVLNKSYLDLISFVSHELKGILAATILNAYSVRDGFLGLINFKQRRALDSVTRNLDYLAVTVKNFFDLSRIEKGEMTAAKKEIDLRKDVFEPALEAFAKAAEEKPVVLVDKIPAGIKLIGDPDLLQIVANNLIGNAIKYGTSGGKIEVLATGGERLKIEIYNDGRPLKPEEMARIFNKFSRLDGPETRRARGTGLGLFITRQIVEKHGGFIKVVPGETGNSFIFEIERGV